MSTTLQEAKEKLKKRYNTFTLPLSGIEVKYRKPNPIESAIQNKFPTFLSELIVNEMKDGFKGKTVSTAQQLLDEREFTDADVADFLAKGYILLKDLSIEPKFTDTETEESIRVKDVEDRDALAFLKQVLQDAQTEQAVGGGEISEDSLATFPEGKRVSKRNTVSEVL